jgi:hypothetical protein
MFCIYMANKNGIVIYKLLIIYWWIFTHFLIVGFSDLQVLESHRLNDRPSLRRFVPFTFFGCTGRINCIGFESCINLEEYSCDVVARLT